MFTFMVIGGVGLLLLVITTLLSYLTAHDSDAGFGGGHDMPSFDHDTGAIGHTDTQETGPSPLSLRTISIFFTIFGATGAISMYYGASALLATIFGMIMGFIFGWIVFRIIKMVYRQQGNSNIDMTEFSGLIARTITLITSNSPGEVVVSVGGQRRTVLAYAKSGEQIPTGSQVKIVEINGNSVVVELITPIQM
jgi:membrane protein implicated in regulation of membrane protease activity